MENVLPTTGRDDPSGHGHYNGRTTFRGLSGTMVVTAFYLDDGKPCPEQTRQINENLAEYPNKHYFGYDPDHFPGDHEMDY